MQTPLGRWLWIPDNRFAVSGMTKSLLSGFGGVAALLLDLADSIDHGVEGQ
jgi:hypothetical protein